MFDTFLVLNHLPVTAECKSKCFSTHTPTLESILNLDTVQFGRKISQLRLCYECIRVQ